MLFGMCARSEEDTKKKNEEIYFAFKCLPFCLPAQSILVAVEFNVIFLKLFIFVCCQFQLNFTFLRFYISKRRKTKHFGSAALNNLILARQMKCTTQNARNMCIGVQNFKCRAEKKKKTIVMYYNHKFWLTMRTLNKNYPRF